MLYWCPQSTRFHMQATRIELLWLYCIVFETAVLAHNWMMKLFCSAFSCGFSWTWLIVALIFRAPLGRGRICPSRFFFAYRLQLHDTLNHPRQIFSTLLCINIAYSLKEMIEIRLISFLESDVLVTSCHAIFVSKVQHPKSTVFRKKRRFMTAIHDLTFSFKWVYRFFMWFWQKNMCFKLKKYLSQKPEYML